MRHWKEKANQEKGKLRLMHLKDTKENQGGIQESNATRGKPSEKETVWPNHKRTRFPVSCWPSRWPVPLVSTLVSIWKTAAGEKLRQCGRALLMTNAYL